MSVWLLRSRRGGLTCGHLHVREPGAWRCRETQAEPAAWSVVSTRLTEEEGARPKPDWGLVMVVGAMLIMLLGLTMGCLAGLVSAWVTGVVGGVVIWIFGVATSGLLMAACGKMLVDEYRDPSPSGGGWDWF